jgi:hypothetical protein
MSDDYPPDDIDLLSSPVTLPNGVVIPNRLVKVSSTASSELTAGGDGGGPEGRPARAASPASLSAMGSRRVGRGANGYVEAKLVEPGNVGRAGHVRPVRRQRSPQPHSS